MLYQTDKTAIESEKERNLYTKFFGGYYFNEFISGVEKRIKDFSKLLNDKAEEQGMGLKSICLNAKSSHITFDAHGYLFPGCKDDTYEMADVLISNPSSSLMIPIEVKYLTALSAAKDLEPWLDRLKSIQDSSPLSIVPVALMPEQKWRRAEKMKKRSGSNVRKFEDCYKNRVILLFWEDLLKSCVDSRVKKYMEGMVSESKGWRYAWENGKLVKSAE